MDKEKKDIKKREALHKPIKKPEEMGSIKIWEGGASVRMIRH